MDQGQALLDALGEWDGFEATGVERREGDPNEIHVSLKPIEGVPLYWNCCGRACERVQEHVQCTVCDLPLFEAMQLADVRRLVFSSTAAVHDVRAEEKTDEASALGPCSPYGASKLMVGRIIQDLAAAYQLDYMILRYFNVAGADAHGRSGQCASGAAHL